MSKIIPSILLLIGFLTTILSTVFDNSILIYTGIFISCIAIIYLILKYPSKKMIILIILFAIFLYLTLSLFWANGIFWQSDSFKFLGATEEIVATGHLTLTEFGFQYPTRGYHILMSVTSLLTGFEPSILLFRLFSIIVSVLPIMFIYSMFKKVNLKFALLSSFLLIFGIGSYYITFVMNSMPHTLGLLIIAGLIYLDYFQFQEKSKSKNWIIAHVLLFTALLSTHNWGAFVYLSYYAIFSIIMVLKENKKRFGFNFLIYLTAFMLYLYFVPWVRSAGVKLSTDYLMVYIIGMSLFIGLILLISVLRTKINNQIKKYMFKINKSKNLPLILPVISFLILFLLMGVIYSFTPYLTEKSLIGVLFSHLHLVVSSIFILTGLIYFIQKKEKGLTIILPWILVTSSLFLISFILLYLNIRIVFSWRHLTYLSLLAVIPLAYLFILLSDKKVSKVIISLCLAILLISITVSTQSDINYKYTQNELNLLSWIKTNVQPNEIISGDNRLTGPIWSMAKHESLFNFGKLYNLPISKETLGEVDYIIWTDEFNKQGVKLDELGEKNDDVQKRKFENSKLMDNIYSNQKTELYMGVY